MKETIKNMLEHPIATIFIICCIFSGIVNIIKAAKGTSTEPVLKINMDVIQSSGENY